MVVNHSNDIDYMIDNRSILVINHDLCNLHTNSFETDFKKWTKNKAMRCSDEEL